jgi:hypothetical protein
VHDPVEPGLVRVGEAALSLDPLSSQGIQTALVGALQAAIVTNTWLRSPARAEAADAFYRDRHGETVARSASNASRLYAEAAGRFGTPFWTQRSAPPAPSPPMARRRPPAPDPSARLKLAPGVRVGRTAVVRDDLAEFACAIVPAGAARPVAFVSAVPVGELAGRLVAGTQAVELVRMWSALVGEAAALNALTWMWQTGVVDGDAA